MLRYLPDGWGLVFFGGSVANGLPTGHETTAALTTNFSLALGSEGRPGYERVYATILSAVRYGRYRAQPVLLATVCLS